MIKANVGMMIKESGGGGLSAKEETVFYRCVFHAMHDAYLLSVVCPKETTGGFDIDLNIDHQGAGILSAEVRKRELGDWQPRGGRGYHDV